MKFENTRPKCRVGPYVMGPRTRWCDDPMLKCQSTSIESKISGSTMPVISLGLSWATCSPSELSNTLLFYFYLFTWFFLCVVVQPPHMMIWAANSRCTHCNDGQFQKYICLRTLRRKTDRIPISIFSSLPGVTLLIRLAKSPQTSVLLGSRRRKPLLCSTLGTHDRQQKLQKHWKKQRRLFR